MLKLVKKHDWLELKAENLLLKDEVDRLSAKLETAKAETAEIEKKVDAWQEKKPYCGGHCNVCKHGYTVKCGYVSPLGFHTKPETGCMLEAKLSCYLFEPKEVEEAGK